MNCPDAFTALAERQAFQCEQACVRACDVRASERLSRVTEEASVPLARSVGTESTRGHKLWLSYRREEEEEKEDRSRERGEKRVSHRVLFLSAQRDERYEGTRGGFYFMISGRHYYGGRDGVAALPILFPLSRWNLWAFPEYFSKERES